MRKPGANPATTSRPGQYGAGVYLAWYGPWKGSTAVTKGFLLVAEKCQTIKQLFWAISGCPAGFRKVRRPGRIHLHYPGTSPTIWYRIVAKKPSGPSKRWGSSQANEHFYGWRVNKSTNPSTLISQFVLNFHGFYTCLLILFIFP